MKLWLGAAALMLFVSWLTGVFWIGLLAGCAYLVRGAWRQARRQEPVTRVGYVPGRPYSSITYQGTAARRQHAATFNTRLPRSRP